MTFRKNADDHVITFRTPPIYAVSRNPMTLSTARAKFVIYISRSPNQMKIEGQPTITIQKTVRNFEFVKNRIRREK